MDDYDLWLVMVQHSSQKQKRFFGNKAWRPYITIRIPPNTIVDDELVRKVVRASFCGEKLKEAEYKKHFVLEEGEEIMFQYAKMYVDDVGGKVFYDKFTALTIV